MIISQKRLHTSSQAPKGLKGGVCDEVGSRRSPYQPQHRPHLAGESVTHVCARSVTHVCAPCREGVRFMEPCSRSDPTTTAAFVRFSSHHIMRKSGVHVAVLFVRNQGARRPRRPRVSTVTPREISLSSRLMWSVNPAPGPALETFCRKAS